MSALVPVPDEAAAAVLDVLRAAADGASAGRVTGAAVLAAVLADGSGAVRELAAAVRPPEGLVGFEELVDAAEREAEAQQDPLVRREYLVLALVRAGGATRPELVAARRALAELRARAAGRVLLGLEPVPVPVPVRGAGARRARAVVVTGLPGSGKSTLAAALAEALPAALFDLDWQLGALTPFGLVRGSNGMPLAEHLLLSELARGLRRGADVVLDGVGQRAAARASWYGVAARLGGELLVVECVCPDEALHRERVARRARGIPGWPATVSWEHVERTRAAWEDWDAALPARLRVDTREPVASLVPTVLAALGD